MFSSTEILIPSCFFHSSHLFLWTHKSYVRCGIRLLHHIRLFQHDWPFKFVSIPLFWLRVESHILKRSYRTMLHFATVISPWAAISSLCTCNIQWIQDLGLRWLWDFPLMLYFVVFLTSSGQTAFINHSVGNFQSSLGQDLLLFFGWKWKAYRAGGQLLWLPFLDETACYKTLTGHCSPAVTFSAMLPKGIT